jgi:hypothetical protein
MAGMMAVAVPIASQIVIDGAVGIFVIYSWILDESSEIFA